MVAVYGPAVRPPRAESPPATLGGGRVLQPGSRRYRRRDARTSSASPPRLADPATAPPRPSPFLGLAPWTERASPRWPALSVDEVAAGLASPGRRRAPGRTPVGPRRTVRVLAEFAADLEDRVLRALGRLHAARPRQSAIPRVHLAAELPDLANEGLVAGLLDRLKPRRGRPRRPHRRPRGHEPEAQPGRAQAQGRARRRDPGRRLHPARRRRPGRRRRRAAAAVPDLLALLRDEEQVAEINPRLFLDFDAEAELRRRVRDRLADGSTITMAELRDLLGTTRKYAVPIGEYLDRIGLTVREGDAPPLNRPAKEFGRSAADEGG